MSAPQLNRVDSFQYPAAHLGHLTDAQQAALDAFKQVCQEEGYYKPAGTGAVPEPSHDDETLLRYLRARRFIPQEAFKQFKDTEEWRKENHLEELYGTIDVNEYEQCRRLYPQWTGRRDKRGIPVYVFEVAHLNSKNIAAYEKTVASSKTVSHSVPTKMLRLFALYENLTRFVMPLCSAITDRKHPETPISQSNNIVDISKVGLKQFWNLKSHMQDASQLATAHYPETLDRIFIIGAPGFFPTVWGWVKRWFDPITVSKIFILSQADMFPTLSQYIDPDNIPKKYGGNLDFEFGMMPVLEPAIEKAIKWENPENQDSHNIWPIGPISWEQNSDRTMTAVAVGTEAGAPRKRVICKLETDANIRALHGGAVTNTPIPEDELGLTTVGTATQPPDTNEADLYVGQDSTSSPQTDTPTSSATPANEASSAMLPIREQQQSSAMRSGTSSTKYAQQDPTHASGQLAEGTPDAALDVDGHGTKTFAMEPNTVGQAPKDMPLPDTEPEQPQPGYLDQAKQVAGQVVETATHAVESLVGAEKKEEVEKPVEKTKSPEEREMDAKIDAAKPAVEGFLRGQYGSK
ncbi:CRAL/TRIO domain-containing protein [Delitschia confertaspora ATCC 74209]|uniref:CRAL/TRIO domain-containing protein n=1 Tax=Delitschia confertaspora ATCC 74209 TaxID=1513339 RepID=A0A9P4JGI9_9PLEO|nr:CRAL/TRIO domain-containing protein [Delitschia confertaspora ATCC 74209]